MSGPSDHRVGPMDPRLAKGLRVTCPMFQGTTQKDESLRKGLMVLSGRLPRTLGAASRPEPADISPLFSIELRRCPWQVDVRGWLITGLASVTFEE